LSKKAFEAARDTGNILIAQVKANQPTLRDALEAACAELRPGDRYKTVDSKRHGRQEHRLVEVFDVEEKMKGEWKGLVAAVARVTRLTWHKDTKSGFWHETEEVSFYASLTKLPAITFGSAIRLHWGIENRNNYVRDVTLNEDKSRIRIAPATFARFRSFAMNIMRSNGVTNVQREIYLNALNPANAMAYNVS
jgi:predicted transposase YbfD/YdcC